MGRSGGRQKLTRQSGITRGQLRLLSDSDLDKMVVKKENTEEYSPGPDHPTLLSEAAEIWMSDPKNILDPKLAAKTWRYILRTGRNEGKDSEEYWARALQALLYQAKVGKPETTPVFRCQPFLGDHPLDRVRGWGSDIDTAFKFAKLVVENDHEINKADDFIKEAFGTITYLQMYASSGKEPDLFKNNGRITTSIYVIDDPEHGFSINGSFLKEERDRQARELFREGEMDGIYHKLNPETGKWDVLEDVEKLSSLKTEMTTFIIENIDNDRLASGLGLEEVDPIKIDQAIIMGSFESVTGYLEEIGDQDSLNRWQEALAAGQKEFNQSKDIYCADHNDCYLNENEVIIDPGSIENIRRVEVILAESKEELIDLTDQKVVEKMKAATDKQTGNNPKITAPGQKTLFD